MICGIDPVYAKKLLRAFGEKVFDVIEAARAVRIYKTYGGDAVQVMSENRVCWS